MENNEWYANLHAGDEVWWNDPDHGISSGYYTIEDILAEDEILEDTVLVVNTPATKLPRQL